ncbi:MAG: hypothetical protein DHS80DRAFT_27068 [Piptocephalis tieghemiana]|nr:MAG: hypothetical protein DHS80DRAFT_27068 [Piptocephalis tieghemiana]
MPFGQLVLGPPGSGKSTYCEGMRQFLTGLGRKVSVVNLDPANEGMPYPCALDVTDLVSLTDVMEEYGLGPNGGVIFCMEYLLKNMSWLLEGLDKLKDQYLLIDCPGQVELFTHHHGIKSIVELLGKKDYRLCTVHLVDAHYCTDAAKYISVLLLSLRAMIQIELPHINVLSKVDLLRSYGQLAFNLDYYTEVQNLSYLADRLDEDPMAGRFPELNRALCELVEDYSLVGYELLNISDKDSVARVAKAVDRANGYVFGGLEPGNDSILLTALRTEDTTGWVGQVQERSLESPQAYLALVIKSMEGGEDWG